VVRCIRDAASGYALERPGLDELRRLLREGAADVVVAYAVDRLSRNQNHIGVLFDEVQRAGARLEFVTEKFEDTAVGRFILAARAFIAEVEREKIVERTTRGRVERARSGRLPGGTGRGCYGYVYNPTTGRREIEPFQAEIVQRIFQRFAEIRSISAVTNELNDAGIPSISNGQWSRVTIRRMLMNESYAGRLVYRRTRSVTVRSGISGRLSKRHVQRPIEDQIQVEGASPRIVEEELWRRVQKILAEPERSYRRACSQPYPLRGRARCGICNGAMIGQTIKVRMRAYRYYQCRRAHDRRATRTCSAGSVRADRLEAGIWREITRVLTNPSVVLQELERQTIEQTDGEQIARLEREIASLLERERRLVRLYTYGEIDEHVIRDESTKFRRERQLLEERLRLLHPLVLPAREHADPDLLATACSVVADWLERATEKEREMALEALQVAVTAKSEVATLTGVLPIDPSVFSPGERSSRGTSGKTARRRLRRRGSAAGRSDCRTACRPASRRS
jgi:site-specific DNA recombinase